MSSPTTPYLERLKEGLRQLRPLYIDDLWTLPQPSSPGNDNAVSAAAANRSSVCSNSSGNDRLLRPWGMDNDLGHLYAENLDWWCSREELLLLLQNDDHRLDRLVHVMVTSAVWINQWSASSSSSSSSSSHPTSSAEQQDILTISEHGNTLTKQISSCVGCNFPFDAASSSHHSGQYYHGAAAAAAVPPPSRREHRVPLASADQHNITADVELHLHLLIITMSVICSLIRHNHGHDDDAKDRLILLLSVDTPTLSSSSNMAKNNSDADVDPNVSSALSSVSSSLPSWIEQQLREGKPQATIPIVEIIQHCCTRFPKAAVWAAGLLSLVTCHRPAVVFNTMQQHDEHNVNVFMSSLYSYLDRLCLPLLLVNDHDAVNDGGHVNPPSSSSSCLVQERFGLVAFLNIIPTLYHLSSWKAARRHLHFDQIVASLVSCIIHICHSATTTTTTVTKTTNNTNHNDSNSSDNTIMTHNDGPPDLENLVELIGAKFTVLESLLLAVQPLRQQQQKDCSQQQQQQQQQQQGSSSFQTPSLQHDDDANWRSTIVQQRPMSTAVAAGLEVLSWWARHGVDFAMVMDKKKKKKNGDTTITILPRIKIPMSTNGDNTAAAADDDDDDDDDTDNKDGSDGNTAMLSISACFTRYLPRINVLAQRVSPHLDYMETMARSLALGVKKKHHHHEVDASTAVNNATNALFLEESFSLARDRCGLPSCRRRQRQAEVEQQQQQQGSGETNGDGTCRSCSTSSSSSLKFCHGGCKGLERYCCREHQKEHWPIHKMFCKSNSSKTHGSKSKSSF